MVKSTPIANITSAPNNEPTDIEQLVDESAYHIPTPSHSPSPQGDLQAQIELLKLQLQANAASPPPPPPVIPHVQVQVPVAPVSNPPLPTSNHQFSQVTNDIINKTTIMNMLNTFDVKLFIIVIISYLALNSTYITDFLTSKLDVRNLNYLKPFIISCLMAVAVVTTNNI